MNKVFAVLGSIELHRVAALVAVVFVAVQGFIAANGTQFGLDAVSLQTALSVVGGIVVVAREFNNPAVLPFVKALFGAAAPAPKA